MSFKEKFLRGLVKKTAKMYYRAVYGGKRRFDYVPVSGKLLGPEELCNMVDASLDMWLTTGRFNRDFEKEFAKYLGLPHCLTVNSGSSADLLALSCLTSYKLGDRQVKKGDEVITVAAGFPTTVNPIIQNGLVPVFLDVDIETGNIDTEKLEKSISPKTKVVMIAHTLGNLFDLDKVTEICKKHGLWLIEDNCDALGAEYDGKKAGTFGDLATFSFYPAHFITMGEGGAVATKNPLLYKIVKSMRDWGRDCFCEPGHDDTCKCRFSQQLGNLPFGYDHKYTYSHVGYNLKITDWQAACGAAQLKKADFFISKRRENFKLLFDMLSDLQEYLILPEATEKSSPAWFGFLISVKQGAPFKKQELVEFLENNQIGTRQLFAGNILRQPYFTNNEIPLRINDSGILLSNKLTQEDYKRLPNTDFIMNNTFWVGIFPALGEKELRRISDAIHAFVKSKTA